MSRNRRRVRYTTVNIKCTQFYKEIYESIFVPVKLLISLHNHFLRFVQHYEETLDLTKCNNKGIIPPVISATILAGVRMIPIFPWVI